MEADSHSQPSQVPSRRANFTLLWKIGQNVIDFISVSAASFRGDKFGTLGRGKQERRRRRAAHGNPGCGGSANASAAHVANVNI